MLEDQLLQQSDILVYYSQGMNFVIQAFEDKKIKDYKKAIKEISQLIKFDSKNYDAHILRGSLYLETGQSSHAESDFSTAVELNPQQSEGYYLLADALQESEYSFKTMKVMENYSKAVLLNPIDHYRRGVYFKMQANYNEAVQDLNQAIYLYTNNANCNQKIVNKVQIRLNLQIRLGKAYEARGCCLSELGKLLESLADFSKAIEINSKSESCYNSRAELYEKMGQITEAKADYLKVVEIEQIKSQSLSYYRGRVKYYEKNEKKIGALIYYSKIIEMDPDDPPNYICRAQFYEKIGKTQEAQDDYSKAIELEPDNSSYYICRGTNCIMYFAAQFYEKMRKTQEALDDYSKAIELEPYYLYNYIHRAQFYEKIGKTQEAQDDYSKAIELEPDNSSYYICRAQFYEKMRKTQEALDDYSKAIELKPDNSSYYICRDNLLEKINELPNTKVDLQIESQLNQDHQLEVQFNNFQQPIINQSIVINFELPSKTISTQLVERGIEYQDQNQLDKALEDFNASLSNDPSNNIAYIRRGQLYLVKNQLLDALSDCNKAIELNPNHARAYHLRGEIYQKMKDLPKAVDSFSQVIELDSTYKTAYISRANIYMEQKKYSQAIDDFSQYLQLDPNCASAYLGRGNANMATKNFFKARRDYTQAIQLDPKNSSAYVGRGLIFFNKKKHQEALSEYSIAIQQDSECVLAYYNRGITYIAMNKTKEALDDFLKAYNLQPNNPLFSADLGYFYLMNKQPEKAISFIQEAKILMTNSDVQTLSLQYNLGEADLEYINKTICLCDNLAFQDQNIEKIQPKVQNTHQLFESFLNEVLRYKNENVQKFDLIQKFLQLLNNELLEKFNKLVIEFNIMKERLERIERKEILVLEDKLKELKEPQNENKKIYYTSFCSRLLAYFGACALIQTGLVNANSVVGLDSKSDHWIKNVNECAKMFSPLIGSIPIAGTIIEQILVFCDKGLEQHQDKKFKMQVDKIMAVLNLKAPTPSEREREVQMAAFTFIDGIKNEDIFNTTFQFQRKVSEISKSEFNTIPQACNLFWQLGIENSLIIIKNMINDSELIVQNQEINLRDLLIELLHKPAPKESKQIQEVPQSRESSCCSIQ